MNDSYKELAAAIVERAVLYYRAALMTFRIVTGEYLCR